MPIEDLMIQRPVETKPTGRIMIALTDSDGEVKQYPVEYAMFLAIDGLVGVMKEIRDILDKKLSP